MEIDFYFAFPMWDSLLCWFFNLELPGSCQESPSDVGEKQHIILLGSETFLVTFLSFLYKGY